MSAKKTQKTKVPVLQIRINSFIESVKAIPGAKDETDEWQEALAHLWDDEIRFHFDNGRSQSTIGLYVAKYRSALKATLGADTRALATCNVKKLNQRLDRFIAEAADEPDAGEPKTAKSVEEKIERAQLNSSGPKPKLQIRISDFIANVPAATSREEMEALWKLELKAMDGKAKTTIAGYITKYRNAIREAYGDDHPMLRVASGDPELYDDVRREKATAISNQHRELIEFTDYQAVIDTCSQCLVSEDPMTIAIGLMGVTGRRPFEIFTTAELTPAPYKNGISKWSVNFHGQAKTKGREGTRFNETYEIPVLAPAKQVLSAYQALRDSVRGAYWLGMSSDDFQREVRHELAKEVVRLFQKHWPASERARPYGLRHLYAEVAYRFFCPPTITKNSYFALILGHNTNDLETSLSYMSYCLPDNREDARNRVERAAKRTSERMEMISGKQ